MDEKKECGELTQKIFEFLTRLEQCHRDCRLTCVTVDMRREESQEDRGDCCLDRIKGSLDSFFGGKHRENLQFITFGKWFHNLFDEWEKQGAIPASSKFIVYLLNNFIMSEDNFKVAQNMNIIDKYGLLSYKNMCQEDDFIALGDDYVTYLLRIMSHDSGLTFIKERKIWEKVVDLYFIDSKDKIMKEGEKLLRSFLKHHMLKEILQYTLKYATFIQKETIRIKAGGATSIVFLKENEELLPFLNFFATVLEMCFEMQDNQIFAIPLFLIDSVDIKFVLKIIMETSEEEKLLDVAARLSAMLNFLSSASFSSNFITKIPDGTMEILKLLLERRKTTTIMELVQSCRYIICKSNSRNALVRFDPSLELDFLLFQLIPLMSSIKRKTKIKRCQHPTVQDPYVEKLCEMSTETSREIVFLLRDATQLSEDNGQDCVPQCSRMNLFTHNHNDVVLEALIEIMKEFTLRACNGKDLETSKQDEAARLISSSEEQLLLYVILFLHGNLVFDAKGPEKILQGLNVCIDILKNYHHLYPLLAENTLDLIIIILQHFILSDCASQKILLEQYDCELISLLAELMVNEDRILRLHSIMAVGRISELADAKCPKLVEKLVESNILSQIVEIAENNSDAAFKDIALQTLAGMVPIKRLWERNLNMSDFSPKILKIMEEERGDDEDVRYSAILLATKLYEHADCGSEYEQSCCEIFYRQSTSDPDWITRRDSLEFWEMLIRQSLKSNDFVDGSFPENISVEEKKFRLKSVLSKLAGVGCLTVLLHALNDSDVRVFEKSREIVLHLLDILNQFDLLPPSPDRSEVPTGNPETKRLYGEDSATNDERDIEIKSDRTIDDVEHDNNALSTVFERTKGNKNLPESHVSAENVDPDFFIQTVKLYELENAFDKK